MEASSKKVVISAAEQYEVEAVTDEMLHAWHEEIKQL